MSDDLWLINRSIESSNGVYHLKPGCQTVGRSLKCDIHIDHKTISRFHAAIVVDDHGVVVRDLGSCNGTFVNDHRIVEATLKRGNTLRIGQGLFDVVDRNDAERFEDGDSTKNNPESSHGAEEWLNQLSPAQFRVVRLLLRALSEKQVAHQLRISEHTVHNHVKDVYRILRVHSRAELITQYGAKLP